MVGTADPCPLVTTPQASQLVVNSSFPTQVPSSIQQLIQRRLEGFPQKALDTLHYSRCILPSAVAKVLALDPSEYTFGELQSKQWYECFVLLQVSSPLPFKPSTAATPLT